MMGIFVQWQYYPERCGLAGYFQFVVLAQDYGTRKPDSRLFEIAIERAGCTKRQLLHVGDSCQNDIIGAKRAGVRSVWLNRQGSNNEAEQQPDFEISSFRELTEVLEKL